MWVDRHCDDIHHSHLMRMLAHVIVVPVQHLLLRVKQEGRCKRGEGEGDLQGDS